MLAMEDMCRKNLLRSGSLIFTVCRFAKDLLLFREGVLWKVQERGWGICGMAILRDPGVWRHCHMQFFSFIVSILIDAAYLAFFYSWK